MKFAFLIHPISAEISDLVRLDQQTGVLGSWGADPLGLLERIHGEKAAACYAAAGRSSGPVVIDEIVGPPSAAGNDVRGQLIEIPMRAAEILEYPDEAMDQIMTAVKMATDWGAKIVGLGAMTGVVGGRGQFVAEQSSIAVTTGNSLTVYAAIQTVFNAVNRLNLDLTEETIAVVGIPGSIASAAAIILAPYCKKVLLVSRRASGPAQKLAEQLNAELLQDIDEATQKARIILTATSSGDCIDQHALRPGTIVIDVGVPADVIGDRSVRPDVLVLTGGLAAIPADGRWTSQRVLRFQLGMIPSCLGETMNLGYEDRAESYSLGRSLCPDSIREIGAIADRNGFQFSQLCSFGQRLEQPVLTEFRKFLRRTPGVFSFAARTNQATGVPIEPAMDNFRNHINPPMATFLQHAGLARVFVRGEGTTLIDSEGRRYFDAVSGFGSVNFGHNHPAIVEAVQAAIAAQAPGFAPAGVNPYAAALAEELVAISPPGLQRVFLTNSGTESTEAALKLARAVTGRPGLLHCTGSYHGKSLGSLSVTGRAELQRPFGPLLAHVDSVPYGDVEELERALSTRKHAAFLVEPVQGESGMHVPPVGYLTQVQSVCREYGTLLIVDEVQTGLGRTGAIFACQHEGVEPDILTLAKSLGGGMMPLGAVLSRPDLWDRAYGSLQTCMLHSSTFSGGSLACAAGLAALRTLQNEQLSANAAAMGERLMNGLREICRRYECLREVRGMGLMIGLEFHRQPKTAVTHWAALDPTGMSQYMISGFHDMVASLHTLQAMYILLNRFGIHSQFARTNPQVLRIQPPLTITREEADRILEAIEMAAGEIDLIGGALAGGVSKSTLGQHDARSPVTSSPAPAVTTDSDAQQPVVVPAAE